MSENLDLVRSIYAAFERGDYTAISWADPKIEFVLADRPAPGSWSGLDGMARAVRDGLDAWRGFSQKAQEFRELDERRVLVLNAYIGRGKTSGLQLQSKGANLFHLRGGKVIALVHYWERERALADLGLAPEEDGR
jgi:ketosteroid isomerase-like protein